MAGIALMNSIQEFQRILDHDTESRAFYTARFAHANYFNQFVQHCKQEPQTNWASLVPYYGYLVSLYPTYRVFKLDSGESFEAVIDSELKSLTDDCRKFPDVFDQIPTLDDHSNALTSVLLFLRESNENTVVHFFRKINAS